MGDRALVQFKRTGGFQGVTESELSPCCYLHWAGSSVADLLRQTADRMADRGKDVSYGFARFVGIAHESLGGPTGLGVWNQPTELTEKDSHGDAGCFVVELDSVGMLVSCSGGYGLRLPRERSDGRFRIYWRPEEHSDARE